jgi:hypothetical protein
MTDYDSRPTQPPAFRDLKAGLVGFGILQIIFGAFCALMAPFMALTMAASSVMGEAAAASGNPRMMIPAALMYVGFAVWFITMGVGSVKARRWARALILVSSWIWLISGLMAIVYMVVLMPGLFTGMAQDEQIPSGVATMVTILMSSIMALLYVVVPTAHVVFYGLKDTKATCEARDPQPRWTDRCPLPVLALSLMFAVGGFFMLWMPLYGSMFPLFGRLVTGIPAAATTLGIAILLLVLAWGTYRLHAAAWWASLALMVVGGTSGVMTFWRVSLLEIYEQMDFPADQIQRMQQIGLPEPSQMALWTGVWVVVFVAYVLFVRKYFATHEPPAGTRAGTNKNETGVA